MMEYTAAYYRKRAREALNGRWLMAIVTAIIASLLGGVHSQGISLNLNVNTDSTGMPTIQEETMVQAILETWYAYRGIVIAGMVVGLLIGLVALFLNSIVSVGYAKYNLAVIDGEEAGIGTLFAEASRWKTLVAAKLWKTLYVFVGMILLVVPGILATYSYAMADYLLAEHPEMTAREALARSKEIMRGNRWKLFCLQISFIGWSLLSMLTCGIGQLWLTPYTETAISAFYRHVSGTERYEEVVYEDVVYEEVCEEELVEDEEHHE